jgi:hypothetical protein
MNLVIGTNSARRLQEPRQLRRHRLRRLLEGRRGAQARNRCGELAIGIGSPGNRGRTPAGPIALDPLHAGSNLVATRFSLECAIA